MRQAVAFGLVACLAFTVFAGPTPSTAEQVTQLIGRLGSPAYHEREAAYRALDGLGEPALNELRLAISSADSETARRAGELVRRIEQRAANARHLAPTLVDVSITDAPVPDAVRDFARITGLPITLGGDTSKVIKRKVTFKSGRVSVWEAYAGFVRAAELTEWDGLSPMPGLPTPLVGGRQLDAQAVMIAQAAGGGRVIIRNSRATLPAATRQLWLHDGAGEASPTFSAGAVRIRALAPSTLLPSVALDNDQFVIPLQTGIEPKLFWSGAPLVKSATAVDELGQQMTASVVRVPDPIYAEDFGEYGDGNTSQRNRLIALRFTRGEKPSSAVRELKGTLNLPVRVKGAVASIDDVLRGPNAVRGISGFTLRVEAVEKAENGDVKMTVNLELPIDSPEAMAAIGRFTMAVPGRRIQQPRDPRAEFPGLALETAQGQQLNVETSSVQADYGGELVRVRLTVIGRGGQTAEAPLRLTYSASFATALEVPFHFTDLPMP